VNKPTKLAIVNLKYKKPKIICQFKIDHEKIMIGYEVNLTQCNK
jgi:hypothetical protein